MTEVLVLRHVVLQHVKVNDGYTDGLANLRTSQSHAVRSCQRLEHVGQQFLQIGIVRWNILSNLTQHGLPININW